MSPTNSFLTVGLTALGLFGFSANSFARAQESEAPSRPPSAPAPTTPAPDAGGPKVLLLYNGEHVAGEITVDGNDYVLHRNGGEIHIAKDRVEESFATILDLYQYKLNQIPEKDPDEHLKLARWCLVQKLDPEAKTNLQLVLKISPQAREARAMLVSMQNAELRVADLKNRELDSNVMQSKAEMTLETPKRSDRPSELDDAVIRKAQREFGLSGLPVIFDLPPALAVKRADQFTKNIQPILQASCIRCHNENENRPFQLVELRNRRAQTSEISRSNLDAVLQFVDASNPQKSEILSTILLPHGGGRVPRPVFRGANDPKFQILAAWVTSLRITNPKPSSANARVDNQTNRVALKDSDFGIDRADGPGPLSTNPTPRGTGFDEVSLEPTVIPPSRFEADKSSRFEKLPPNPDEFPLPIAVGGTLPRTTKPPRASNDDGGGEAAIPLPKASKKTRKGEREIIEVPPEDLDPTKADPLGKAKAQAAALAKAKSIKPKAAKKIDPTLLERTLMNRNGAGPN